MSVPYKLYNKDCREVIPTLSGIDAVITDPPYGLGKRNTGGGRNTADDVKWDVINRDLVLSVISLGKKSVVWGGNYFSLPPTRCWLVWYKRDAVPSAADCEIAWTSEDANSLVFDWTIAATNKERVNHPTQKPIALMKWCIEKFSNVGDIVFDPFMGSGSTGVAALQMGRRFVGCEISPEYFAIAKKRIEQAAQQPVLMHEAQQSVHLTASGAGGRGQNSLQSSFIADDPSAKHGGR